MSIQIVSLVITVATMLVSVGAIYGALNSQMKHLEEMFRDLTQRVNKHNNLVERMAVVERDQKTAFLRIDEIREDVKDIRKEFSKNAK